MVNPRGGVEVIRARRAMVKNLVRILRNMGLSAVTFSK